MNAEKTIKKLEYYHHAYAGEDNGLVPVCVLKEAIDLIHRLQDKNKHIKYIDTSKEVEITIEMLERPKTDIWDMIREAQENAVKEGIKANSIVINKKFVKVPSVWINICGSPRKLPPMICGLEVYFTDNELPDNYSFALLETPQTERERLIKKTKSGTAKEICDLILEHWEKGQYIECDWLRVAISERYGVEVE